MAGGVIASCLLQSAPVRAELPATPDEVVELMKATPLAERHAVLDQLFEEAETLPPDSLVHVTLLEQRCNVWRRHQQSPPEYLELIQRALALRERVQGPMHPDLVGTLHQLAMYHLIKGELRATLEVYQRRCVVMQASPEHADWEHARCLS
ncbi:MAG: tetratricopeptide repeat protein, partial [Acidobacteriota bacterium]